MRPEPQNVYRKIPGLPAPIRLETRIEAYYRQIWRIADGITAYGMLRPGKPKFTKDPVNQPR